MSASKSRRGDWAGRIALIAASVLVSLALLEVASRVLRSGPEALVHWPNLAWNLMRDGGPGANSCSYIHDDLLGWASPSNCVSPGYNLDANGFRRAPSSVAPEAAAPAGAPVLATGASFTLGIEVADDETWPAYLEGELGRPVINAGVGAYSIDQTVLNTERLAAKLKPAVIIVSFAPGDVWRNELSVAYSRQKPYFEPTSSPGGGGELELRNVPIAKPLSAPPLPVLARLFGWSVVAAEVVERLGIRNGWYYNEVRALPPGAGDTVSCRLMPRLAKLGVPVIVMAQYGLGHCLGDADYQNQGYQATSGVLRCAKQAGLIALDLAPPMKAAIDARGLGTLYRSEHNSPEGNHLVAELLASELTRLSAARK
jgi:hypothetical protein